MQGTKRLLSTLVETAPAGIAVLDRAGIVILWNQSAERIFGWKGQEVLGQPLPIVPPERRSEFVRVLADVLGGATFQGEVHRVRKDGTAVDVHLSAAPLRDGRGKVWGALGIFTDISERKRAEDALRESEERFREIIEKAPHGYCRVGKDGLWQCVNATWERMHGLSREQVVGKSFEIAQPKDSVEQTREYVKRALAGEAITAEFSRVRADGKIEHYSLNIQPVKHGKEILAIEGFINDITERKRSEEMLRREHALLSSMLETSPVGIIVRNRQGQVTFANRHAERVLGLERGEIVGRTYNDPAWRITDYDGAPIPEQERAFVRVMTGGQPIYGIRQAIEWPDGQRRLLSISAAPLLDAAGEPDGTVAAIEDVTESVRIQRAERLARKTAEVLQSAHMSLTETLELGSVLERLLDRLETLVPFDSASVMLVVDDSHLAMVASRGYERWSDAAQVRALVFDGKANPIFRALLSEGKSVVIGETGGYPGWEQRAATQHVRNWMGIPLRDAGRVIGLYSLDKAAPHFFTQEHLRLAEALSAPAVIAIKNARLFEKIQDYAAQLELQITERKRAEEALRASESELRALLAAMTDVILVLDSEGRYIKVASTSPTLPYRPAAEKLGKTLDEVIPEQQAAACLAAIRQALETRQTVSVEYSLPIGGEEVWFAARVSPMLDNSVVWVARDITERKRAEQALRESEERYRTLVMNTPALIFTCDLGGTLLSVNPAAGAALGYEPADLVGMNLRNILAPSVRHLLDGYLEHIQREPAQSGPMRVITRTGEERTWIYHNVLFAESGKAPYVIGGALDITERRRAEEARRESEERLQFVACATNDVVWDWDLTTNKVWWNDAIRTRFGYSVRETETDSSWWAERIHPDDRDRTLSDGRRREAGDDFRMDEYRFRRADGDFAYVLDRSYVVRDHQGTPVRVIGTMVDLTEHKQAEQALRESEAKYRTLFDRVNDAILIFEPESEVILEANEAACQFYGFARDELIGTSLKALTKDVGRGERQIRQILERGSCLNFPTVHLDKQGRFIDVLASCTVIEYEGKRAVLSINRDVTELRQTEKKLRQLSGRLLQVQDEERRRIARELHDVTAQNLTALAMSLSLLVDAPGNVEAPRLLADSLSLARRSLGEIRGVSYLLHPPLLDELGLAEALGVYTTGFSQRTDIQVALQISPDFPRLPAEVETALFRIVQESLSNVQRHSGSRSAHLSIELAGGQVVLRVQDHGHGFRWKPPGEEIEAAELGVGIIGMRERARELGGGLEIESDSQGTTVIAQLPLDAEGL